MIGTRSVFVLVLLSVPFISAARPAEPPKVEVDGKPLADWIKQFSSSDAEERRAASKSLAELTLKSNEAVTPLVDAALTDSNLEPAWRIKVIADLGPAAVPALNRALFAESNKRRIALLALSRIGFSLRQTAPAVRACLTDDDALVRVVAIDCLIGFGDRRVLVAIRPLSDDSRHEVQRAALEATCRLGEVKEAVPVLIKWLKSEQPQKRDDAAILAAALGPEAAPAAKSLAELLSDPNPHLVETALIALGEIGAAAEDAIAALVDLLKDRPDHRRLGAISLWRIARHDAAVRTLREVVSGDDYRQSVGALSALVVIDPSTYPTKPLNRCLENGDKSEQALALTGVEKIGRRAKGCLPAIRKLLASKDPDLVDHALFALARLGPDAKPALADVEKFLTADRDTPRFMAAEIAIHCSAAEQGLKVFKAGLQSERQQTRMLAAGICRRLGPAAKRLATELTKALDDRDVQVRIEAAESLWTLTQDKSASAALVKLTRDPDAQVRSDAAMRLGVMGPGAHPEAVAALSALLWDQRNTPRQNAAEALGRVAPEGKSAVPQLIALLESDDQDPSTYSAAAEALGLYGRDARSAVESLKRHLNDPQPYVRAHAALALWRVAEDKSGRDTARALLKSRHPQSRIEAAEAIWEMDRDEKAITMLIQAITDAALSMRSLASNEQYMATRALGRIGPAAAEALPVLRSLLDHQDPYLAQTAVDAIRKIESKDKPNQ